MMGKSSVGHPVHGYIYCRLRLYLYVQRRSIFQSFVLLTHSNYYYQSGCWYRKDKDDPDNTQWDYFDLRLIDVEGDDIGYYRYRR